MIASSELSSELQSATREHLIAVAIKYENRIAELYRRLDKIRSHVNCDPDILCIVLGYDSDK